MRHKRAVLFALSLFALAGTAGALQTDELIAITAMPLAVADVVALPGVPQDEVFTVVTTLNHGAVPAAQFVEIVRYIPLALAEPAEPRFATYVTREYERGLVGQPLALAIADRYDTYGYDEVVIDDPPVVTYVERREFLPQVVVTRYQPVEFDPLALIAMPLAVAAVADLVDVPRTDLMQFVSSLNRAMMPAPQFVEVVRYSPVMLVDRTAGPQFIRFVTTEVDRGIIGRPLAFSIARRIDTFQPVDIDVVEPPRLIVRRDEILPPVVTRVNRVASVDRNHPHGGPPGQLKKELGLQTGAEVVHGTRKGRAAKSRVVVRANDDDDDGRERRVTRQRQTRQRAVRNDDGDDNRGRSKPRVERSERPERKQRVSAPRNDDDRGGDRRARGQSDRGNGKGEGKGNGKGKGKGKG